MKLLIICLLMVSAFSSQAADTLSPRHQALIVKGIAEKCQIFAPIQLVDLKVREDRVDQGIVDYYFESTFTAKVRLDQNIFDIYDIKVQSMEFNAYDHQAQEWGMIVIESIKCEMR